MLKPSRSRKWNSSLRFLQRANPSNVRGEFAQKCWPQKRVASKIRSIQALPRPETVERPVALLTTSEVGGFDAARVKAQIVAALDYETPPQQAMRIGLWRDVVIITIGHGPPRAQRRRYFKTAQATRAPAPPIGCDMWSSGLACTTIADPSASRRLILPPLKDTPSTNISACAEPSEYA